MSKKSRRKSDIKWSYTFPDDVSHGYAKRCYWDLMNDIRREPYMPEFRVTKYLKMRYRIEDEKLETQT